MLISGIPLLSNQNDVMARSYFFTISTPDEVFTLNRRSEFWQPQQVLEHFHLKLKWVC